MRKLHITSPIIAIIPSIAILGVIAKLISTFHAGGSSLILDFAYSAITPSVDPLVIKAAINGLKLTLFTTSISWGLSSIIGLFLGILSSRIVSRATFGEEIISRVIRCLLCIPRSVHELIWGLLIIQLVGLSIWVSIIALVIPYSAINARVISDQIDNFDTKPLLAIRNSGATPLSALLTALLFKLIPTMVSYFGYRLECTFRGAVILGIFGMGGIGTELELTLKSLEFNEMWTSLWFLAALMFLIEALINKSSQELTVKELRYLAIFILPILLLIPILFSNENLVNFGTIGWHPIPFPSSQELKTAFYELPILNLISRTLILTVLSAGIAIGIPPLIMFLWPGKNGKRVQTIVWFFLRLIPPPLTALLIQLTTFPSIAVGALALGCHNVGILGRLLKESIKNDDSSNKYSILATGADARTVWLYGIFSKQSNRYLAYSAYRTDVLLRETSIVGLIGGTGLGWQIIESLSSFDWNQLIILVCIYSTLTIAGELISDKLRDHWLNDRTQWEFSLG